MGDVIALAALPFPEIPEHLLGHRLVIEPCNEVRDWAQSMFLDPSSAFYNEEHSHLEELNVGFLWTNATNELRGSRTLGTAEVATVDAKSWGSIRRREQIDRWFGSKNRPSHLITLDAVWLSTANPASICALIEHELYHCDIVRDRFGAPKLDSYNRPKPALRPHDLECFIGEARRYGPWSAALRAMKEALEFPPEFGEVELAGVCGTCHVRR